MAAITRAGLVVFVESDSLPWDGAGTLGAIHIKRFAKSYQPLNIEPGLYASPAPLPDGRIMVSRRPADGSGNHDIYLLDPDNKTISPLVSDQRYHLLQSAAVAGRPVPDGRSSVVNENIPHGQLYCLDVSISDSEEFSNLIMRDARRVRLIEGIPGRDGAKDEAEYLNKRILGETDIKPDGSFFVEVPANTPIKVQIIDEKGMSLRSGSWIWVRNHEPRGCIGCHEDPELTPPNRMVDAVKSSPLKLTLPPARRRSVSLHDNLLPIIEKHCSTAACHGEGSNHVIYLPPAEKSEEKSRRIYETLTAGSTSTPPETGGYVVPGRARTSPLFWHITGENTAKKWDQDSIRSYNNIIQGPKALSPEEVRMFIEWIDLGAHWKLPAQQESSRAVRTSGRQKD